MVQIQRYMPNLSTDTCQLVINVLNDQLKTTLMLQFPAKILAVAALKWILSFGKNKPVRHPLLTRASSLVHGQHEHHTDMKLLLDHQTHRLLLSITFASKSAVSVMCL